jgi:hypothetical protein
MRARSWASDATGVSPLGSLFLLASSAASSPASSHTAPHSRHWSTSTPCCVPTDAIAAPQHGQAQPAAVGRPRACATAPRSRTAGGSSSSPASDLAIRAARAFDSAVGRGRFMTPPYRSCRAPAMR